LELGEVGEALQVGGEGCAAFAEECADCLRFWREGLGEDGFVDGFGG
jgi:hypothetical protein